MIYIYLFQNVNNLIDSTMKSLKIEINKVYELQNKYGIYMTNEGAYNGELRRCATITYDRLSIYMSTIANICKLLKQNEEYGNGYCFGLRIFKASYEYFHNIYDNFMKNPLTDTYRIDAIVTLLCECYFESVGEFERVNKESNITLNNNEIAITILYLIHLCRIGLPQMHSFEIKIDSINFEPSLKTSAIINKDLFVDESEFHNEVPSINTYTNSLPDLNDTSSSVSSDSISDADKENVHFELTTLNYISNDPIFDYNDL